MWNKNQIFFRESLKNPHVQDKYGDKKIMLGFSWMFLQKRTHACHKTHPGCPSERWPLDEDRSCSSGPASASCGRSSQRWTLSSASHPAAWWRWLEIGIYALKYQLMYSSVHLLFLLPLKHSVSSFTLIIFTFFYLYVLIGLNLILRLKNFNSIRGGYASTGQPKVLVHKPGLVGPPSTAWGWRCSDCAAASACCCSAGSPGGHGERTAPQTAPEMFHKNTREWGGRRRLMERFEVGIPTWKRILLSPRSRSLLCRLTMKAS